MLRRPTSPCLGKHFWGFGGFAVGVPLGVVTGTLPFPFAGAVAGLPAAFFFACAVAALFTSSLNFWNNFRSGAFNPSVCILRQSGAPSRPSIPAIYTDNKSSGGPTSAPTPAFVLVCVVLVGGNSTCVGTLSTEMPAPARALAIAHQLRCGQEAACWAHVRRKFYHLEVAHKSPVASEALERIAALYAIEKEIRGHPPDERREVRNTRSRPLLESLKQWFEETLGKLSRKSDTAMAVRYALVCGFRWWWRKCRSDLQPARYGQAIRNRSFFSCGCLAWLDLILLGGMKFRSALRSRG
jgi:hypothetical protein